MEKISNEEYYRCIGLARQTEQNRHNALKEAAGKLPKELADFIFNTPSDKADVLTERAAEFIRKGGRLSDFVEKSLPPLFGECVYPRFREYVLYIADNLSEWAYGGDIFRRSFRTKEERSLAYLLRGAVRTLSQCLYDTDVCGIIDGKLTAEQKSVKRVRTLYNSNMIACEIDKGNTELIQRLLDIMAGKSEADLDRSMILGICKSRNTALYKGLGEFLLNAGLEEGARQAVVESMDLGRKDAFLYLLGVIRDNKLIRYSSVKRGVMVWTGIGGDDYDGLDRSCGKALRLICECLSDKKAAEKYFKSEDSIELLIALWSLGVDDIALVREKIEELAVSGSRHQVLTAGYVLGELGAPAIMNKTAKYIYKKYRDDIEILAVYSSCLLNGYENYIFDFKTKVKHGALEGKFSLDIKTYFEDAREALDMYALLGKIYASVKIVNSFDPCVFPWYEAELCRIDLALKMIFIAALPGCEELADSACAFIPEIGSMIYPLGKEQMTVLLLNSPKTETQLNTVIDIMSEKKSSPREVAKAILNRCTLSDTQYERLEALFRLKTSGIRADVEELITKRNDDGVFNSVSRLLKKKGETYRTAAMDIILNISKDENRKELYGRLKELDIKGGSGLSKILAEQIEDTNALPSKENGYGLYDPKLEFTPKASPEFLKKAEEIYSQYFPNASSLKDLNVKKPKTPKMELDFDAALRKLDALIELHKNDEITMHSGEVQTLSTLFHIYNSGDWVLVDLWEEFFEKEVHSEILIKRMAVYSYNLMYRDRISSYMTDICKNPEKQMNDIYSYVLGKEFTEKRLYNYPNLLGSICSYLADKHSGDDIMCAAGCVEAVLAYKKPLAVRGTIKEQNYSYVLLGDMITQVVCPAHGLRRSHPEEAFAVCYALYERLFSERGGVESRYSVYDRFVTVSDAVNAAFKGYIPEGFMYKMLFERFGAAQAAEILTELEAASHKGSAGHFTRIGYISEGHAHSIMQNFAEKPFESFTDEDRALIEYAAGVGRKLTEVILSVELKRGETSTEMSGAALRIKRVYGAKRFVEILTALSDAPLTRAKHEYSFRYNCDRTKNLCYLLSVCVPEEGDSADTLRSLLKGTGITEKRLIEAALYSPEWLDMIGGYLGWKGFTSACLYFIAHTTTQYDELWGLIARFTPLSKEELAGGAFDGAWFKEAYEEVGVKRFNLIFGAAKYISDGAAHIRARKYAMAALGNMDPREMEKEITAKRNRDTLMAYAVIPIKDEDELSRRYLFIQQFRKESKQFGQMKRKNELSAAATALKNLSVNAGYSGVMRLTMQMEAKITDDIAAMFSKQKVVDVVMRLVVNDDGKAEIECEKDKKPLKSVPARLKTVERVVELNHARKMISEQYRRTRDCFENAMETRSMFTAKELSGLYDNPALGGVVKKLLFMKGDKIGFFSPGKLTDYAGVKTALSQTDELRVAHPFDLYKDGHWHDYQRLVFEGRIKQPFKQVFRELYLKTEEENGLMYSPRYAGNQIRPKQTLGILSSRGWIANYEEGLQKVCYKDNIVATLWAQADWFSPADVEDPAVEKVIFFDRKTGEQLKIKDIPDIIFSEVMRDIDLVVSVAHSEKTDPEASGSTIEMRKELAALTTELFKLKNVTFGKTHALIKGERSDYTVHLGSGVVHTQGGAMIAVIAVHSRQRGRVFLPFADDDPKTSEVITKILMFAEDAKIKDPAIISQII